MAARTLPGWVPEAKRIAPGLMNTCRTAQEAGSQRRSWHQAGGPPSKEPIPASGNPVVNEVSPRAGKDPGRSQQSPWQTQVSGNSKRGIRTVKDPVVGDQKQRPGMVGIVSQSGVEFSTEIRLDGQEMEAGGDVAPDDEGHCGIAKVADSVEHNDMRLGKHHGRFEAEGSSEIVQFRESNVDGKTSFGRKPAPLLPEF